MIRNHPSIVSHPSTGNQPCGSGQNQTVLHPAPTGASGAKPSHRVARPLELPRDLLALTLQKCRQESGKSTTKLAYDSGLDVAHVWRIEQGERQQVSREILVVLSLGLVLDADQVDEVIAVANQLLDAAGLKTLRPLLEPNTPSSRRQTQPANNLAE